MPWQNIASIPGNLLERELSRKEGGSSQPSINWPGIARDQLSGRNYVLLLATMRAKIRVEWMNWKNCEAENAETRNQAMDICAFLEDNRNRPRVFTNY